METGTGDGGSTTTPDGGAPSIEIAQSSVQRDPAASIPSATLAAAVTANNAFAVDLYAQLRATSASSNLLTSPISASLALTMTYAGAVGTTATQMATALHLGSASSSIFDGQNALSQALAARAGAALTGAMQIASESSEPAPLPSDYQFQLVNSVWGEKTYTWQPPFLGVLAKSYGTGVFLEDFIHQWDPARLAINAWVSNATSDKINDLLPPGALDAKTRMVLVNAIHLKFPWATAFATSSTVPGTFTRADASTVSASLMNLDESIPYVDDGQAQVAALPLAGNQVDVVIALPHGDLATYEASLTAGSAALSVPSATAEVDLSLPKATFTSPTFSLATALKAMGMTQAFDPANANFTGLCANPPDGSNLYIADVLQKATLAMQETGVEAAAATAVLVSSDLAAQLPPTPVPMVVNKPYLVAIVDAPTGAILFLGHITDPTDTGSP